MLQLLVETTCQKLTSFFDTQKFLCHLAHSRRNISSQPCDKMKTIRRSLAYLKRYRSRQRTVNPPDLDLTTATESKQSSRSGASFNTLPAELQYMIHLYALSDLEIRIGLEESDSPDPGLTSSPANDERTARTYTLSSSSLAHLHFYQNTLFPLAADWHHTHWESHVLFIFPSALSLLEVFTSPAWPRDRLSLVRRIRLHEHDFYYTHNQGTEKYREFTVLRVLFHLGMVLDLLEFAPIKTLHQFITGSAGFELRDILLTPICPY